MHEDLISVKTIKLAIAKGFEGIAVHHDSENVGGYSNVPYQAFLQRWLREIHSIDVLPYLVDGEEYPYCCIVFKDKVESNYLHSYKTYEEALEAGLQAALVKITNKH